LYIFLEQRWIITINFNSQQLQSNIRQKISKSLMPSHRSVPIPLSEQQQQQQQQQSISSQRNVDSSYNRGICEMVYRFAIEEIISGYYPILDSINAKLEQIEDHVILQQQPTKSQLLDILVIRRKLGFLENTLTMITTAFTDIINGVARTKLSKDSMKNIR